VAQLALNYPIALNTGKRLLKDNKKCRLGFHIMFSITTGLCVSDVIQIKYCMVVGDKMIIVEKKTKTRREITISDEVKKVYAKLIVKLAEQNITFSEDDYIFISKNNCYTYKYRSGFIVCCTLQQG
jgi:integrase